MPTVLARDRNVWSSDFDSGKWGYDAEGGPMDADSAHDVEARSARSERLAAYLGQAKDGDLTALDAVVVELNPLLWRVARSQGLLAEDASDVVQTTWMELVRHLDAIRSPLALVGWLVAATKREAWRVNARRRKTVWQDIMTVDDPAADEPEPVERLLTAERHRVLWRHFARLSDRCRALLSVVAKAERPNYAAISEALDMTHGSIGPTRGRCLAKLRAMLLADPLWGVE
jgi:RNA polymerase sigma factor (sigma-70 family)